MKIKKKKKDKTKIKKVRKAEPFRRLVVMCARGRATFADPKSTLSEEKLRKLMDREFHQDAPHRVFWVIEERDEHIA